MNALQTAIDKLTMREDDGFTYPDIAKQAAADLARLERLAEYADHKPTCCTRFGGNVKPCDCGFAALAAGFDGDRRKRIA